MQYTLSSCPWPTDDIFRTCFRPTHLWNLRYVKIVVLRLFQTFSHPWDFVIIIYNDTEKLYPKTCFCEECIEHWFRLFRKSSDRLLFLRRWKFSFLFYLISVRWQIWSFTFTSNVRSDDWLRLLCKSSAGSVLFSRR